MKLWLKTTAQAGVAFVVLLAAAYPFLRSDPVADAQELAGWQMPSRISALDSADQKKLLARLTYPQHMPALTAVPDFAAIKDTAKRKKAFFEYLEPFIERENSRLLKLRAQIVELQQKRSKKQELTLEEYAFIYSLFDEFKVDYPEADDAGINDLLSRVDVIPSSLVLTQAAKESGWGSSRFATDGFNFFGQWCFKAGCGFVPAKRPAGKYHEVAMFKDIAASVNAYFYNLNTFYVYDDLRAIRAEIRKQEGKVTGQKLAQGLIRYSERGESYVSEIRDMIAANHKFMEES
ncbi:glucosaminidase domain-containing protein [Rheinheimera sp. 4Y26]|uniref:glucosaminidase domain-containing protein n=1 Tax=Rheinheimera sp. 4Y26 TaxID=2977811 RepID=UPI0021B116B0|nr:glucosaminidase domain-containing protein [Rheinheimera sp. 4Y26]MCT6700673.1 glucosaminidase domain-containing protein [Rheinheimera sp. 4Y26]